MVLINLNAKFNEIKEAITNMPFSDVQLSDSFKTEYAHYISKAKPNGYASIEWSDFSAKITTTSGKVIFLTNFWFYIAAELSTYLDGLSEHKRVFKEIFAGNDLKEVALSLKDQLTQDYENKIRNYFTANSISDEDYQNFLQFLTDYTTWGGGKSIDRNDYYVSPLLQAGNLLAETQSAIAEIAKQFSESRSVKDKFEPIFLSSKSSPIIKDKSSSDTQLISNNIISKFIFDTIKFLIDNDVEQPLFNCLIRKYRDLDEPQNCNLEYAGYRLTSMFKVSKSLLSPEELESGGKPRFILEPLQINSDSLFYYLSTEWTNGRDSRLDILNFIEIFNSLYDGYKVSTDNELYLLTTTYSNTKNLTLLSKPFLLLAGISGTGKTRFVREQAKMTGSLSETYCLTSVRPDWHEPSDLLGYISRLSGHAQYVTTDVLKFIAKAWRAIIDADLDIVVGQDNRLSVLGNKEYLEQIRPYWLCLDEMNLAPVEQYFADYLSILETREWQWTDDEFDYRCDAILKPTVFNQVADIAELRHELGFEDGIYDEVWALFCQHGMSLPFNLIVAGTVNMDETTHGFSRKVIDRALSFDFGDFFPNDFDHFFNPVVQHKTLSYPIYSQANRNDLPAIDSTGQKSIAFLKAVNHILDNTPFKLAFRALNELLLSVISTNPTSDVELQAVWDDSLMCKVLPRIDGDHDKLMLIQQSNDSNQLSADGILSDTVLTELSKVLKSTLSEIWDQPESRPDLYRQAVSDTQSDTQIRIACRSKAKLEWMQQRLQRSGFTSFWP